MGYFADMRENAKNDYEREFGVSNQKEKHNIKVELSEFEKKLVMYTKREFSSKTYLEDIRVIVSKQYALPLDQTPVYTIYHSILTMYFKLIESGHITESVRDFLEGMFTYSTPKVGQEEIIYKILCKVQNIKVAGLDL